MKYSKVRGLYNQLDALINYNANVGNDDLEFNNFLIRNQDILKKYYDRTEKWVPKKLKALREKITADVNNYLQDPKSDKAGKTVDDIWKMFVEKLSADDMNVYNALTKQYDEYCDKEEVDIKLYLWTPEKLAQHKVKIETSFAYIVKEFLTPVTFAEDKEPDGPTFTIDGQPFTDEETTDKTEDKSAS
jgi:DNA-directed RNA polymerase specialized sigma subunit